MPTYEYVCEKCGHLFEKIQSISAKPLTVCPKELCARKEWGKGKVKRVISGGAGLLFKGSGFYITDYRSENYKQGAKNEKGPAPAPAAASGGEAKSGAVSDAKPAAPKPESKADKPQGKKH